MQILIRLLIFYNNFAEKFAIRISRCNRVGELGYDIHVASEYSKIIYNKIMSFSTDFDLRDAGFRAFHSLSCEKGSYNAFLHP